MMKRILTALPVWVVLCDMLYSIGLNLSQSLNLTQTNPLHEGLPVSPTIAFSSLQVIANGSMVLLIGFGLVVLLQLNRFTAQKWILPIGVFRSLGLLAVLAFSIPSLWEWMWAFHTITQGTNPFNFSNPRYLLTALCLPFIALLCLYRLYGWYRLHQAGEQTIKAQEKTENK